MRKAMTLEEVKAETERLEKSEDVKRGRESEEWKLRKKMYNLRYYEKIGRDLKGGKA